MLNLILGPHNQSLLRGFLLSTEWREIHIFIHNQTLPVFIYPSRYSVQRNQKSGVSQPLTGSDFIV